MRYIVAIFAFALSYCWVVLMDKPIGQAPPLGKFFGPVKGFWKNAVPVTEDGSEVKIPGTGLRQSVTVHFDDRLVPHINAKNEDDLYYAIGYLHAYYRLWQMDMQARAASGRVSEVAGAKTVNYDKMQRRKGMVFAAKNALKAIEARQESRQMLDAYTKGVNAYIEALRFMDYPMEYKMMNFKPEPWTNLKSVLIIKFMADKLTGNSDDISMSYLRSILSPAELEVLFPNFIVDSDPVIPKGTQYQYRTLSRPAVPSGSIWSNFEIKDSAKLAALAAYENPQTGIGSNNWAISGKHTKSGAALLCNDPHLQLNMPSLWYEAQLTSPTVNSYGVTFPGIPGVVIGFNDSVAWGFTNNARDAKDFYEIAQAPDPRFYIFDGKEVPYNFSIEGIVVKGSDSVIYDTVKYTIHGPVMYDEHFPEPSGSGKRLAVRWMAHNPSNELYCFYLLNRAENYSAFINAIKYFESPAQNFIYADRQGNIALWGQGKFINKWEQQGQFVMKGNTAATLWGDAIPMNENPHVSNPEQGYLASANQTVTDETYPYWYNGDFTEFRSWIINRTLRQSTSDSDCHFTIKDMMDLQTSNYSIQMENMVPYFEKMLQKDFLQYDSVTSNLNYDLFANSNNATFYKIFWKQLRKDIWSRLFGKYPFLKPPSEEVTFQLILSDTLQREMGISYFAKASLQDLAQRSYATALDSFTKLYNNKAQQWFKQKNTSITHLSKLPAFSYVDLPTGGDANTLNAMREDTGPSWRMIVEMHKDSITAYGIYPGGQSGNPGSKFYDSYINDWVAGNYNRLTFYPKKTTTK